MQTRRFTRFPGMTLAVLLTLIGAPGLVFGPEAHADGGGCSEATLRGAYGVQLQGTLPAGPDGPIESVIGVVRRVYDGQGHFTQVDNVKGSITGIVPDREGSGTYEVAEDCTGVTTFEPAPGVVITEKFVIVNRGLEVFSIVSDPPPQHGVGGAEEDRRALTPASTLDRAARRAGHSLWEHTGHRTFRVGARRDKLASREICTMICPHPYRRSADTPPGAPYDT